MPVTMKNIPGGQVQVSTPGGIKAKATSFQKAMAQKRLLNAVEHGWTPGRRRSTVPKMPMKPPKGMPKGMM
jgi:hypothetical protein